MTGRTKGTLSKAIASGRLAYVEKTTRGYLIDVAELERVYPPRQTSTTRARSTSPTDSGRDDLDARALRIELDLVRQQLEDVRVDRDAWREHAKRLAKGFNDVR